MHPSVGGKGWGWEFPGNIGFRDGPVEVCFLGRVTVIGRVEGVEYCPLFGAEIEGDKMVGAIVIGAATCGYGRWVLVGGARRKMLWSCPPMGGFP